MVFAAAAQSLAFSYRPFVETGKRKGNVLKNIGYVLNVKDVLNDAHNTFIRSQAAKDSEQETQIEDVMKDTAFNWSDEETPDGKDNQNNATTDGKNSSS